MKDLTIIGVLEGTIRQAENILKRKNLGTSGIHPRTRFKYSTKRCYGCEYVRMVSHRSEMLCGTYSCPTFALTRMLENPLGHKCTIDTSVDVLLRESITAARTMIKEIRSA